jgi:hypothetical protein
MQYLQVYRIENEAELSHTVRAALYIDSPIFQRILYEAVENQCLRFRVLYPMMSRKLSSNKSNVRLMRSECSSDRLNLNNVSIEALAPIFEVLWCASSTVRQVHIRA